MDNKIVVKVNMFALKQTIYTPDGKVYSASMKEVADKVCDLCHGMDIYEVVIKGKSFAYKLSKEIYAKEISKYQSNKIRVKGV